MTNESLNSQAKDAYQQWLKDNPQFADASRIDVFCTGYKAAVQVDEERGDELLTIINELYDDVELLTADDFNAAIIGIDERNERIVYSVKKCISILMRRGMTDEEAYEYFEFKVEGSYMGEHTPVWCYDDL